MRCLRVSQCHQLLVKEMEVKQMKWHAEGNPLVYAKLAPNKQKWFLDKHKQGDWGK